MPPTTFTLNNFNHSEMPAVGLGTWQMPPDVARDLCVRAVELGYRHIDTAYVYENEEAIGYALNELVSRRIISSKNEVFVTSKLWNTQHGDYATIRDAYRESCRTLDVEKLSMYLIHWPVAFRSTKTTMFPTKDDGTADVIEVDLRETWTAMSSLYKDGLVDAVGVSNFGVKQIEHVLTAEDAIMPANNQYECNLFCQREDLLKYCKEKGIVVTAYSPLGGGLDRSSLMGHPLVAEIASTHKVTPAQVLLAWCVNAGMVCIPKTNHYERVVENFNCEFMLTSEEMLKLKGLDKNKPTLSVPWSKLE
ncbi:hypothetical protein RCL1_004744 [Eukaryota sp. TZLM3-RCL]